MISDSLTFDTVVPSEAAKKQFRAPRCTPGVSSSTSFASQEDDGSQVTPSPESCSLFNKFSLTPIHSPLFGTPTLTPSFEDIPTEVGGTRFKVSTSSITLPTTIYILIDLQKWEQMFAADGEGFLSSTASEFCETGDNGDQLLCPLIFHVCHACLKALIIE